MIKNKKRMAKTKTVHILQKSAVYVQFLDIKPFL